MADNIGDRFQEETKYDPERMGGHSLDWENRPEQFKTYRSPESVFSLPRVDLAKYEDTLSDALLNRRSRRSYDPDAILSLEDMGFLLWSTQGVTGRYGDTLFRTAPSAGALYPIETYLMVRSVESLQQGIYHFRVGNFDLELLRRGNFSDDLAMAALSQSMVARSMVTFIWTAVIQRSRWKYGQRSYRYIYLDAGHICQNLYLGAESAGLGCCAIGAFFDDWVNDIIGVDGKEETAVYLATIGLPKKKRGQL
jgi:SagB-type dehydrogenase family enzyme